MTALRLKQLIEQDPTGHQNMIKKMLSLFKQWHAFLEFEKEELTLRALQEGSTGEARGTVRKLYR